MKLGKYQVFEEIGRGGFGIVYKATLFGSIQPIALKVLHSNLVNNPGFVERFLREARYAMALNHENIVKVFDCGQENGFYYISMEYMENGSLKDWVQKHGPFNRPDAFRIFDQVAAGVEHAHNKGIIHRDLKPGNILFDSKFHAKIADLGFAKAHLSETSLSLSMTGGMIGTPNYMAPELWEGRDAKPTVDQYSLGCILYEMLTADKLFDGDTTPTIMLNHFKPPEISQNLRKDVREVILRSTQKLSVDRFENITAMRKSVAKLGDPLFQKPKADFENVDDEYKIKEPHLSNKSRRADSTKRTKADPVDGSETGTEKEKKKKKLVWLFPLGALIFVLALVILFTNNNYLFWDGNRSESPTITLANSSISIKIQASTQSKIPTITRTLLRTKTPRDTFTPTNTTTPKTTFTKTIRVTVWPTEILVFPSNTPYIPPQPPTAPPNPPTSTPYVPTIQPPNEPTTYPIEPIEPPKEPTTYPIEPIEPPKEPNTYPIEPTFEPTIEPTEPPVDPYKTPNWLPPTPTFP